jgi:Tfp pilus assembly protein PilV
MVEMLMAAFVMAIGLLGLAMLQTMSLRAAGGSKNMTMAVQLAEQMMDQIELEGRLTYNNATIGSNYVTPTALTGLQFYNQANVDRYFNIDGTTGNVVAVTAPQAGDPTPLFHLNLAQAVVAGVGLSDVTITVDFIDGVNKANNQNVTRTATITRRILHA